jgi:GTP-binding protein HflX
MTRADVLAQDMLFATLDPTLRGLRLPHGAKVMLSDTVGFISDLPTMLVSAFRATLEEVIEADVILHVRDISHADTEAQSADVSAILHDLGIEAAEQRRIIEVWNKADLLAPAERERVVNAAQRLGPQARQQLVVSSVTGEGVDALLLAIEEQLAEGRRRYRLRLEASDGEGLAWVYENTEVLARGSDHKGRQRLLVRVPPDRTERFERRFPSAMREDHDALAQQA